MSRILTRRALPRLIALTAAVAATAAVLVPASAIAAPSGDAAGTSQSPFVQAFEPTLVARATLSADHLEPGPASGALASPANGRVGPWAGQVIPGFSAAIDNGDGTFWAQPDNGFGTKGNSADFLLRNYLVRPAWQTADGGDGSIAVERFIGYNDRNGVLDFPIVNGDTTERLLTGADFDIESVVLAKDGTFWVGEEFGPFLLHFDADGTLLEKPYSLTGAKSPQNPYLQPGETPRVRASRGFEALAASVNGRYLYPVIEGSYADDADLRRREIHEFDTRRGEYTGRTWSYQTDQEANVIGDAFTVRNDVLLLVERDDFEGDQSVTKRVYEVDLRRADAHGYLEKTLVLDALRIANPDGIGAGDGYGTGEVFSLPVQSFETVRAAEGRSPAHRQRQQLPRQRRAHPRHARRHRVRRHRPGQGQDRAVRRDRRRSPRRERPPPRAHARLVRDRDRAVRRLHRARCGLHEGRRARRPPRERDQRHDGCRHPRRVRRPQGDEGHRRRERHRLVHGGLHARRAAGRCAPRSACRSPARRTPPSTGST